MSLSVLDEVEMLESMFDDAPMCEMGAGAHSQWGISCSIIATHIGRATCLKHRARLLCENYAASAKDPDDPSRCFKHALPEHIVVLPV